MSQPRSENVQPDRGHADTRRIDAPVRPRRADRLARPGSAGAVARGAECSFQDADDTMRVNSWAVERLGITSLSLSDAGVLWPGRAAVAYGRRLEEYDVTDTQTATKTPTYAPGTPLWI